MHSIRPTPAGDVGAAGWIAPRLNGVVGTIGDVVPTGFDAYARVLHPVADQNSDQLITWAQVAAETGRTVHSLVQWHRLVGSEDDLNLDGAAWTRGTPERGNLHPAALATLLRVLVRHTGTPDDCWFCLWEGWGWIAPRPGSQVFSGPRVRHPGRAYLLLHGPAASARSIGDQVTPDWFLTQSPNLFWPQDRSWCVGTEIDFDSTLVAGSTQLIDDLLAAPDLEVWPVGPDDLLTFDADQVT